MTTRSLPSHLQVACPLFRPGPLCRFGLATRGGTRLRPNDVEYALEHGIRFLNWCGHTDAMSQAVAGLGKRRRDVILCVQFMARTAQDAKGELDAILAELNTGYIDGLTFYYVESQWEWDEICASDGALTYCRSAQKDGKIRWLGVTSHQRSLAASMAQSGLLDMLMIRYNAAHRGAENEIFPVTDLLNMPVVVYTCLRWGALMDATPDDPSGFEPPTAPAWYRFALQSPSVTVAVTAPNNRKELEENLTVLDWKEPLRAVEYERLAEHGRRVRRHGGGFP